MCKIFLNLIGKAFSKNTESVTATVSTTSGTEQTTVPVIPHPEEPPDYTKTVNNINVDEVITQWLESYNVPKEFWDYWRNQIVIEVTDTIPYPAGTYDGDDGKRHLIVRPEFLNPGVIAHENCHNSYALLTEDDKKRWNSVYQDVKENNALIKYLFSIKSYGLTNEIEGHAEIGRFIGQFMPDEIKHFYPKLF